MLAGCDVRRGAMFDRRICRFVHEIVVVINGNRLDSDARTNGRPLIDVLRLLLLMVVVADDVVIVVWQFRAVFDRC